MMLNWILKGDILDSTQEEGVLLKQEFAKLISDPSGFN